MNLNKFSFCEQHILQAVILPLSTRHRTFKHDDLWMLFKWQPSVYEKRRRKKQTQSPQTAMLKLPVCIYATISWSGSTSLVSAFPADR